MSAKYKTTIQISSRVQSPRERAGSDPLAAGAAARLRKDSSPSSSKHVSRQNSSYMALSPRESHVVSYLFRFCIACYLATSVIANGELTVLQNVNHCTSCVRQNIALLVVSGARA